MCAVPVQASLIGRALGHYQVEALIGRGAMGTVYLAKDMRLNRLVALKVLLGSYAQSQKTVQQFHSEAHAAAPLRHENIVRIYTAGIEENIPYIAMEFVDGEPLDRFLRRKGKLEWPAALYIAGQVAMALDCAHEHGVVHRDVKPSNIMLDRKGRVRLTDFGIARVQSEDASVGGSRFVGTPQYMSPEQCTGRTVGPQSDLFSLGVCLYQMISGQMPFEGESSMALIKSICTDDPPRLNKLDPAIPDDVSRIVAYLIEKEPDMRPASARTANALMRRTRKQSDGQSVVAESITEFLKSETEVRPFSRVYEERQSGLKRQSTLRKRGAKNWIRPALQVAGIAICALLAFAAPAALAGRNHSTNQLPPAEIRSVDFRNSGADTIVSLNLPAYAIESIEWNGDGTSVLLRQQGRPDSVVAGQWGLLAIDPKLQRVTSVLAPAALEDSGRNVLDAAAYSGGVFLVVDDTSRGDAVVLHQNPNLAVPGADVLVRFPRELWWPPRHADVGEQHAGELAVSPDGRNLALLLWDPVVNGFGIFVKNLEAIEEPLSSTRTSRRGAIVPGSLLFSPDGSRIGYLRAAGDGLSDLWVLPVASSELDGELVALRVVAQHFSFSPDGTLVAASVVERDKDQHVLAVFEISSARTLERLPNGRVSGNSWHASSGLLLYAASAADGFDSLFAIVPGANQPARSVRSAALGAGEPYSVSPNGNTIAASNSKGGGVRFIEWSDSERRSRTGTVD